MSRVAFFYATGTSYLVNVLEIGFSIDVGLQIRIGDLISPSNRDTATVAGLDGRTAVWDCMPANDPFPYLLDPERWDATRIKYPASMIGIGASIDYGVSQTLAHIRALKPGTPFCLGGYSQGAAVMSGVYNELRYGSLTSRNSDFLGGVMFGNPRRQVNYRGPVGGTWSGAWDVAGSSTGGHGSFPVGGPYGRLSACDSRWVEFTHTDDIFSSTGDSSVGTNWTAANDVLTGLDRSGIISYFMGGMTFSILGAVNAALAKAGDNTFTDAAGKTIKVGGSGHTAYPFIPPVGNPDGGLTSYQIALKFLESKAAAWATAPVGIPETAKGWSTTLIPPAA